MENILIKDLFRDTKKYIGKDIKVSGWVRTVRDSKNFGFIELNDGSFFKNVQIVFNDSLSLGKKRIAIKKLKRKGLDPRSIKIFLRLLEYMEM